MGNLKFKNNLNTDDHITSVIGIHHRITSYIHLSKYVYTHTNTHITN